MIIESGDAQWLDEFAGLTLAELVEISGLPETVLHELIECGVLARAEPLPARWTVTVAKLRSLHTVRRLREDLGLEPDALAITLRLLDRISELEEQLRQLKATRPAG
ncbi:MAG: hypothetical protein KJ041_08650 [Gammaproteobacteria bacterium]|nr:hypothetical protein [Gammaproteobacteria bacterium]